MHAITIPPMDKETAARAQFMTWFKENYPNFYASAMSQNDGLGAEEKPSIWSRLIDGIGKLGGTYVTLKAQKDIIEMNIARAKAGLPPIDIAEAGAAPVVQTRIDLDPATIRSLAAEAKPQINMILIGIAALAAFMVLGMKR